MDQEIRNVLDNRSAEKLAQLQQLIAHLELKKLEKTQTLEVRNQHSIQKLRNSKSEMNNLESKILKFKQIVVQTRLDLKGETNHMNFEKLVKMDQLLVNLLATNKSIKDQDNWNTLTSEMEALYAKKDLVKAGERLMEANDSLLVSANDKKRELLNSLINDYFNLVKEDFQSNLLAGNVAQTQVLLDIFDQFKRSSVAHDCYYSLKKPILLVGWAPTPVAKSVDNLQVFIDNLKTNLKSEFDFLKSGVKSADKLVEMLLMKVFKDLNPSFASFLHSIEFNLDLLILSYTIMQDFFWHLETEYKISKNEEWKQLIFLEYFKIQSRFSILEQEYLSKRLANLTSKSFSFDQIHNELLESRNRFKTFVMGRSGYEWAAVVDSCVCEAIKSIKFPDRDIKYKPLASKDKLEFSVPANYEQEFNDQIENLKKFVSFYNNLVKFWDDSFASFIIDDRIEWEKTSKLAMSVVKKLPISSTKPAIQSIALTKSLAGKYQSNVVEVLVEPMADAFRQLPSLDIWNSNSAPKPSGMFHNQVSSFIVAIGNQILTIPQLFYPFMQDEVMMFSLGTLPFSSHTVAGDSTNDPNLDPTFAWIESIVKSVQHCYIRELLMIKKFSGVGRLQLHQDMNSINHNVMGELEIDASPRFLEIMKAAALSEAEFKSMDQESLYYEDISKLFQ